MSDNHAVMQQRALSKPPPTTDGWHDAAAEAGERQIRGILLKFTDRRWTAGKEAAPVEDGTRLVALATSAMWVRWEDGKPAEYRMREPGRRLPNRDELDHLDESLWEEGPGGEPQDPWRNTRLVYLVDPRTAEAYTFSHQLVGRPQRSDRSRRSDRAHALRSPGRGADRRIALGGDADQVRPQVKTVVQNRRLEDGRRRRSGAGRACVARGQSRAAARAPRDGR